MKLHFSDNKIIWMKMAILDVDSVQAFVMIADLKSFTRAAEALGTTQGAISVKLKRLENRVGHRLIERTPRMVRLSVRGASFIDGARAYLAAHEQALAGLSAPLRRRFVLGIAAHIAGPEVSALLTRLNAQDPALTIEVRIDISCTLMAAFDQGDVDAAIVGREDDRRDGELLAKERLGWFAAPGFEHRPGEPIRLAALSPTCGVHDIARRALDKTGIPWTEVFLGGGSSAVMAAVSAGFAVAPLSKRVAPLGTVDITERYQLPALPPSEIVLHTTLSETRLQAALRTIVATFRDHGAGTQVKK